MLFQKSRIFLQNEACLKPIISSSLMTFSQQTRSFGSKATIDPKLLYPFSQSQTSKALNIIQETSSPRSNSIVVLDRLAATDYSETYRAYDLDKKSFVAQKNIHLDSLASWNQVNLVLRQYQSSPVLAQTFSIDYNEDKQNVKIINELQNTILKDYSLYMKDNQSNWFKERIKSYLIQTIQQLTALKQSGIELQGRKTVIDSQKIFIDKTSQMLKLYDLSDFVTKDGKPEIDQKEFFEIAKQTLLEITNVDSKDMTEFSLVIKKIEYELESLKGVSQADMVVKNLEGINKDYETFILDKISKVLIENPTKNDKKEAIFLRDIRESYLQSAEVYQGKSDFEKSAKCYQKAIEIEESLKKMKSGGVNFENESSSKTKKEASPTILGKAVSGLLDFSYFTFKELMTYVGIAALLLVFGAVYEKYFAPKKEEKKKEDKKPSFFSSAWQKVKNLKGDKSETSV